MKIWFLEFHEIPQSCFPFQATTSFHSRLKARKNPPNIKISLPKPLFQHDNSPQICISHIKSDMKNFLEKFLTPLCVSSSTDWPAINLISRHIEQSFSPNRKKEPVELSTESSIPWQERHLPINYLLSISESCCSP
jgi:hypothetical protein